MAASGVCPVARGVGSGRRVFGGPAARVGGAGGGTFGAWMSGQPRLLWSARPWRSRADGARARGAARADLRTAAQESGGEL